MNLSDLVRLIITKKPAAIPSVGVHHFVREYGSEKKRIHLRIDPDGSGLLMINASKVFHLNPSATSMAFHSLRRVPPMSVIKAIQQQFQAPLSSIKTDYQDFLRSLSVMTSDEACPVCDMDLEVKSPFSSIPTAPYRMDIALTYRCNNSCSHCYNGRPRTYPEMPASDWYSIIDHLWALGIPHIVFTGGEPTLRDDLPDLIRYAEMKGQITGINTNGRKLRDPEYVKKLVDSGLDHVQITLESHIPDIHDLMVCHTGAWQETVDGIKNVLGSRLYIMTNTTMLAHNYRSIPQTLEYLAELGVPTVGLNALIHAGRGKTVGTGLPEAALAPLLEVAKEITLRNNQKLIWYTPTEYCGFDPVQMGLGVKGCSAALYNMCIEPDGEVIPCQSFYYSLGNIKKKNWNEIWGHEVAVSLRERKLMPEKCSDCLIIKECGGGCPLPQYDGILTR